jgi:hypothetical protein
VFKDSLVAITNSGITINATTIQNLATQFATDWYQYQQAPVSMRLIAPCPWAPEGLSDLIQWVFRPEEVSVRVWRPPVNDLIQWIHHAPTSVPANNAPSSSTLVTMQPGQSFLFTSPPSGTGYTPGGINYITPTLSTDTPGTLMMPTLIGTGSPTHKAPPGSAVYRLGDDSFWIGQSTAGSWNKVVTTAGGGGTGVGPVNTLFIGTPGTVVANSITLTSIYGAAVKGTKVTAANFWVNGRTLRFKGGGVVASLGSVNLTFSIKDTANNIVLWTSGLVSIPVTGNWWSDIVIQSDGSNTWAYGELSAGGPAQAFATGGTTFSNLANTLDFMVQWASTNPADTITLYAGSIEQLY